MLYCFDCQQSFASTKGFIVEWSIASLVVFGLQRLRHKSPTFWRNIGFHWVSDEAWAKTTEETGILPSSLRETSPALRTGMSTSLASSSRWQKDKSCSHCIFSYWENSDHGDASAGAALQLQAELASALVPDWPISVPPTCTTKLLFIVGTR